MHICRKEMQIWDSWVLQIIQRHTAYRLHIRQERYCIVKKSAELRALFSYFDRAMIPIVRPATAAAPPAIAPAVSQLS